jgi:hypothetical protein
MNRLRIIFSTLLAALAWLSVITQFYLMLENRVAPIPETIVRFFSFFTILTNTLVAFYFTVMSLHLPYLKKAGTLTAITVYITIVGAVYQVVLRQVWEPTGLQMIVDELLHTINPLLTILFWCLYENKNAVRYKQVPGWLIFPFIYLVYILARGSFSGFYPYPFINVTNLGITKTIMNAAVLLLVFIIVSVLFIFIGKLLSRQKLEAGR